SRCPPSLRAPIVRAQLPISARRRYLVFLGGRRTAHAGAAKPSALDELLATEQEIAAQMAAAEHEASELTSAARSEAETIERNAAAALATELAALDKRDVDAREELVRK